MNNRGPWDYKREENCIFEKKVLGELIIMGKNTYKLEYQKIKGDLGVNVNYIG